MLAAQFGYLPGTLWILVGAVFAGCVQDFVILLFSVRRDGKSLGQMAREEISKDAGTVAFISVLSILVILLAVVALIIVNALKDSPWGAFTIGMTIPIALLMGVYLRYLRPGACWKLPCSAFCWWLRRSLADSGFRNRLTAAAFTFAGTTLAILIIVYGFAASALPVWLLLAPRDYLSTFVKLGTVAILALGIVLVRPRCRCPRSHALSMAAAGVCRQSFSVCVYHHCLRSHQRISFVDFQRHHAQDDRPRNANAHGGLWRNDV